jgi:hypothetical protein
MDKEAIAKAPAGRVTRTPVGSRNILTVKGKDPNYEYRIVNDVDDRIEQFKEAGYEIVSNSSDVQVGDKRVNSASSEGSVKQMAVGQGTKAYLMKIKKDWFQEDQQAKQRRVDELEKATKEKARKASDYGDIST